MKKHGRKLL